MYFIKNTITQFSLTKTSKKRQVDFKGKKPFEELEVFIGGVHCLTIDTYTADNLQEALEAAADLLRDMASELSRTDPNSLSLQVDEHNKPIAGSYYIEL